MEIGELAIVMVILFVLIGSASLLGLMWRNEAEKTIRMINGTKWVVQEIPYDDYLEYAKVMNYAYSDEDIKPGFCFAETESNWGVKAYRIVRQVG